MDRTKVPWSDDVARQCAPSGNSPNDEEWGNDLSITTVRYYYPKLVMRRRAVDEVRA